MSVWVDTMQSLQGPNRVKKQKASEFTLFAWAEASTLCLGHWCSWFLGSQTHVGLHTNSLHDSQVFKLGLNHTIIFLVLQLADSRWWDLSASISMWAKSCNESMYRYRFEPLAQGLPQVCNQGVSRNWSHLQPNLGKILFQAHPHGCCQDSGPHWLLPKTSVACCGGSL